MRFVAQVTIPPVEYPIYITSAPIVMPDGTSATSRFIPEKKVVIQWNASEARMIQRLQRELYNAWNHHWPGPKSVERLDSFDRWFRQFMKIHTPDLRADVSMRTPRGESTRPASRHASQKVMQQQKARDKDQVLKQMDITNF